MTGDVLGKNWCLLGEKKFLQATPTKQDLGTSQGLFSKFPTTTPVFFIWESPPEFTYFVTGELVFLIFIPKQSANQSINHSIYLSEQYG